MKDLEAIREQYRIAVAKLRAIEHGQEDTINLRYLAGVRNSLGWVLGVDVDKPISASDHESTLK